MPSYVPATDSSLTSLSKNILISRKGLDGKDLSPV
jgi:hypothetical protein